MSRCLCCGKPIEGESVKGWHKECIRRFFGTSGFPEIELDEQTLEKLALDNVSKGLTVAGVQKKLSLSLSRSGKSARLTLVNCPTGFILKPQAKEFECLPEAEWLAMAMAKSSGISTVPFALVSQGGEYAYLTKRVDRMETKAGVTQLAMEDFCQLDLRPSEDKYRGSCERLGKIVARYSERPLLDESELFMRLAFSYLIGNSDMHLKNFSLIETASRSGKYVLSPAYDLLPVNLLMPEDKEELALPMNGKKSNLTRKDFLVFGARCGLSESSCEKMLRKLVSMKERYLALCRDSFLPDHLKEGFAALIEERAKILA